MFEVDPLEAIDIDEEADFSLGVMLERSDVGDRRGGARHSGNLTPMGMVNGSWIGRS